MQHAISVPAVTDPARLLDLAISAEAAGWDAFMLWDHLQPMWQGQTGPWLDPWVLLGAIGHATRRIRLGTLLTPLARRRPAKLAKEITTLDQLTGGRVIIGAGLGDPAEDDFAAFGDEPDTRRRAAMLDEGLDVLTACLAGGRVDHDGAHYHVRTDFQPGSVQRPRPPIWIGGTWPASGPLERACRFDGYTPIGPEGSLLSAEEVAEVVVALRARGADHVEVVASTSPEVSAAELADAGADWSLVSTWPVPGWEDEIAGRIADGPE